MATYAGEVRIKTLLDTKGVNSGTKQVTSLFKVMTQTITSGSTNMASTMNMATSSMSSGWSIAGVV